GRLRGARPRPLVPALSHRAHAGLPMTGGLLTQIHDSAILSCSLDPLSVLRPVPRLPSWPTSRPPTSAPSRPSSATSALAAPARTQGAFRAARPLLDRFSAGGLIQKNKAARHKSRLAARIKALATAA